MNLLKRLFGTKSFKNVFLNDRLFPAEISTGQLISYLWNNKEYSGRVIHNFKNEGKLLVRRQQNKGHREVMYYQIMEVLR
jgi:hypothetical protein